MLRYFKVSVYIYIYINIYINNEKQGKLSALLNLVVQKEWSWA